MTLDDLERPFLTLIQNTCAFGAHHENLNEDRRIISVSKMQRNDCSFWQYVLCGYSRGFLRDEASNNSRVVENVDFQGFRKLRK